MDYLKTLFPEKANASNFYVKFILAQVFIFSLSSCSYSDKYFLLNEAEKELFSPFKKGDTLFYENNVRDIDTFLVLGIDSFQQKETGYLMKSEANNNVWVNIKQLPTDTFMHGIFHNDATGKSDTDYTSLFTIEKFPQRKKIQFTFSLRDFYEIREDSMGQLQPGPVTFNGTVIKNYYVIRNRHTSSGSKIKALYWTNKDGLVAYQYEDGTIWTKKVTGSN